MIRVEQGGEYRGETYIWCTVCSRTTSFPVRHDEVGAFEGESVEDLLTFIKDHQHD